MPAPAPPNFPSLGRVVHDVTSETEQAAALNVDLPPDTRGGA